MIPIKPSEITPEELYLSRRRFLKGAGALVASSLILAACGPGGVEQAATGAPTALPTGAPTGAPTVPPTGAPTATAAQSIFPPLSASADELGDALTNVEAVTNYCNFYEFVTAKDKVAERAKDFRTSPWNVEVGGLVRNPKTYGLEDLLRFEQQERVYRLRCVEAWSMVIPWIGFPLAQILNEVEPLNEAKYVRFETLHDPDQMPGQKSAYYEWPYVEGLRIDEAMHDLTILSTGLYGKALLPQNGAPIRLVVPWKYGFKSIKSIVRIDLVEEMPVSLWMAAIPREYGFYANVNPAFDHPRWSQATERRIGETRRRETLLFNGYADEVAQFYPDLSLREWFF
jgi:sulfoxide reductase catalytic subunit YedY